MGRLAQRNNTPVGHNIPTEWEVGEIDFRTGEWDPKSGKNIKWVARLGSQTYGNPVVAGGKVFVGTNNGGGWIKRYPFDHDLGVLLVLRHQGRQVPVAAQQREAADRSRARLARAGRLQHARWSRATGCGTSPTEAKSAASTPKVFTTARTTATSRTKKRPSRPRRSRPNSRTT